MQLLAMDIHNTFIKALPGVSIMAITGNITIPYAFINNNLRILFREGKTSVRILVSHTWRSIKSGVTNKAKYWRIDQVKFVKYSP